MNPIARHYDNLLAAHYSWMNGVPLDVKVVEQQALLSHLGVRAGVNRLAVDLGCGPGYQSFALANLGFETVLAIDTSRRLLEELEAERAARPIKTVCADLRDFPIIVDGAASAIVCMGDTLTHLENPADVSRLFSDALDCLTPAGRLVLAFRDLTTELRDLDRFIPVRADDSRIMTCVLDYEPQAVVVTDLINVRNEGIWTLHKSSYRKLRLQPATLVIELEDIGFEVDHDKAEGSMHFISAKKL